MTFHSECEQQKRLNALIDDLVARANPVEGITIRTWQGFLTPHMKKLCPDQVSEACRMILAIEDDINARENATTIDHVYA